MPIYPAAMTTVAQPLMPPGHWHPTRVTAAVLCFVALVLVISSSFLPLYAGELDIGFDRLEVTITPWAAEFEEAVADGVEDVPRVGYPMVFAAVFLACAAAACWYAATPAARAAAGRVAGLVTAIGTAFLIGTAWTTALLVGNGVDSILLLGTLNEGLETDASYLVGYWLLLTSCLLAFAASVLSLLPVRPAIGQAPPVGPFDATPPYGIALPMQPPPTSQPTRVDPLTGRPVSQPPPGAVDPLTGQPLGYGQASPPAGMPVAHPLPPAPSGAVDPLVGQQLPPIGPVSPAGGLPAVQPPQAAVDPLTGRQPPRIGAVSPSGGLPAVRPPQVADGPVAGEPWSPAAHPLPPAPSSAVDAMGGQQLPEAVIGPVSPSAGLPAAQHPQAAVGPLTGQSFQAPSAVAPLSGRQLPQDSPIGGIPLRTPALVDPLTGEPLSPGQGVPVSPPTGIPAPLAAQPFTAAPVGLGNGAPGAESLPVVERGPIVLPDAPPLPERLPGPAVPATEDPLAEPPRS